jgi:anaerobic nitric oxide reductase flavorubredoxin
MATELVKGLWWVGVVDWARRRFHGHELSTHRGTSYNSYLIVDDKVAIVDSVWAPFAEEFLRNVAEVVDPAKIDYVVVNHSEPDHSGALPRLMELCPGATVVVSKHGAESVPGHYHAKWNFMPVGTGDKLPLGRRELAFVEAPLLHWPDSMFTYVAGDGVLLPNDAFGQHYATAFRFNDQVNREELYHEALKYYANILTPFSARVGPKIDELLAMNVPVKMIAPSHGVLWRDDPMQIVHKYRRWAAQIPQKRAAVLYDSMWEATRRMAEAVGDGLADRGVDHKLLQVAVTDRNDIVTEMFQAKGLAIGSPTLNNGVLPSLTPILEDLRGLKFKNKVGAAFGSYGWSGECVKLIEERFQKAGVPVAAPGVRAKWQPTADDLQACRELGRKLGDAVLRD